MTTEEINEICLKYNIKNYTINEDMSIDVDGNVDLSSISLTEIPLKFRNVTGYFNCSHNKLTSLEGAPSYVGGTFNCFYNILESLEGAPSYVGSNFYCSWYSLKSLKGLPSNLSEKQLYSLKKFSIKDYLTYFRNLKFKKILKC